MRYTYSSSLISLEFATLERIIRVAHDLTSSPLKRIILKTCACEELCDDAEGDSFNEGCKDYNACTRRRNYEV